MSEYLVRGYTQIFVLFLFLIKSKSSKELQYVKGITITWNLHLIWYAKSTFKHSPISHHQYLLSQTSVRNIIGAVLWLIFASNPTSLRFRFRFRFQLIVWLLIAIIPFSSAWLWEELLQRRQVISETALEENWRLFFCAEISNEHSVKPILLSADGYQKNDFYN